MGLTLSFFVNRDWTFQAEGNRARQLVEFGVLVALAFSANLAVTLGLTGADIPYGYAQASGAVTYSALVFAGLIWGVFRHGQ